MSCVTSIMLDGPLHIAFCISRFFVRARGWTFHMVYCHAQARSGCVVYAFSYCVLDDRLLTRM